jgi:lysophospholipase L1-like esterase
MNFTRFGQTVSKGLKMLERKLESIRACDFVFIEFGGNDSDYDWKAIASDPDASYSPKTPLAEFVSVYKKLIATVKEAGLTPIVLNLPPIEHDMYFDRVRHGCNGDNILKWLKGDKTQISRGHGRYNEEINSICRESNVRMIDIRSAFEGRDLTELVCPDGIHPNEKGHELIYEKILSEFC